MIRRHLHAFRIALAIFRERRRLWAECRNEGTDVPVWHAEERTYRIIDAGAEDAEVYLTYRDGGAEINILDLGDDNTYPAVEEWKIIGGAVFLSATEADAWIKSQAHNYPDGLQRWCASCRRGSSLRTFLEAAQ